MKRPPATHTHIRWAYMLCTALSWVGPAALEWLRLNSLAPAVVMDWHGEAK